MAETLTPINPTVGHAPEYSVSEIAHSVKRLLEDRFGRVRVRGEISGWRGPHSSGHAYFRLKDDAAVLEAVCWRGTLNRLGCRLEEGLEVIATGKITSYPGKSNYQIVIDQVELAGAGALMALLEKRKAALAAEGLFDAARKKPLPFLPRAIGVITSPTGAVIRDILHRIQDRFPCHVMVWPVAVQGEAAAAQVAAAIEGFQRFTPRPDVLIVARGGGSIEDLWAFNEEAVVRAAAASVIPLISAVGHETDTTLIDFAADRRAPTPTAAAEMAVPVREELRFAVNQAAYRMEAALLRWMRERNERLSGLSRGLLRPASLLENATQRLDGWTERLYAALPAALQARAQLLATLSASLRPQLLYKDIDAMQARLSGLSALLSALDYRNVIKRGFVLVKSRDGTVITSAAAAAGQEVLLLSFHDGEINTRREK